MTGGESGEELENSAPDRWGYCKGSVVRKTGSLSAAVSEKKRDGMGARLAEDLVRSLDFIFKTMGKR